MPDRYTSLVALVLDAPLEDVGAIVNAAVAAGDIDRASAVRDPTEAMEVLWGGRMQKAVVRRVEGNDGAALLRAETLVATDGLKQGMRRQALLLQALGRQLRGRVRAIRDLSGDVEHDEAWLHRMAAGQVEVEDVISLHTEGTGTLWVHTHGAARFDIPDLEMYGLNRSQVPGAERVIRHVHEQLLRGGLKADLTLEDGTPIYLVPALEAWTHMPLDWPGIGRAGQPRIGHEGPRATVSILTKPRLGRFKRDFKGVINRLPKD